MKPIVIDASAAAPWFIREERTPASDRLYAEVSSTPGLFHAPSLWLWETSNVMLVASRRRRVDPAGMENGLEMLEACPIQFDPPPNLHRRQQIMRLAQAHALSFYDASYLELALRLNSQLASLDRALISAAKACGISCLDIQA